MAYDLDALERMYRTYRWLGPPEFKLALFNALPEMIADLRALRETQTRAQDVVDHRMFIPGPGLKAFWNKISALRAALDAARRT